MQPEESFLDELADSVADGHDVDWAKAESSARTPRERSLVAQLRLLAKVGALRDLDGPAADLLSPSLTSRHDWASSDSALTSPARVPEDELATATRGHWRHLELAAEIGRGAFGTVYRAWDPNLRREVALKLVEVHSEEFALESVLLNEARLLARVRHPNIVAIHGADRSSGQIGLWMEFIHGRTLREIVEERGPFGPREAIGICLELSRAVAAVHAAGLIHRDVKAQNVMREHGGRIVLMDFGAGEEAAASAPRRLRGTPIDMAPELVDGGPATPCSDVYSLGVLLFYLVTGTHPISGTVVEEVKAAHREGRLRLIRDLRPDVPLAFVQCVEQLMEPDPTRRLQTAGAAEAALSRALQETTRSTRTRWAGVAAALAAAVLFGIGVAEFRTRFLGETAVQSVAVLPMVNLSGDSSQECLFVDGMTDLLIAELSRISSLRVTSRTSVMGYKQTTKRIEDIARELGVETVLEASVMLAGAQVRMNASLIRVSDQTRLWSHSYERPMRDAFGLQSALSRDLTESVRLVLTSAERRAFQNAYVPGQEAQDLFLRGRFVFHLLDRARLKEACGLIEQSVKLEPRFAAAWASLSRCIASLEANGLLTAAAARPLVSGAASRAIAEDAGLAEAHASLAQSRFLFDWDWVGARQAFDRAIQLNPSDSFARDRFSRFLAAAGMTAEAVEHARRGVQSDPQSAEMRRTLALILFYHRSYDEALVRTDEAAALEPGFAASYFVKARIQAALGRHDDAQQSIEKAVSLAPQPAFAWLSELGRIYALTGRRDEALATIDKLPGAVGADGYVQSEDAAYILAALGRPDEAMVRLQSAVDARSSRLLWLRVDPRVDGLRDHDRFAPLLKRIGGLN